MSVHMICNFIYRPGLTIVITRSCVNWHFTDTQPFLLVVGALQNCVSAMFYAAP